MPDVIAPNVVLADDAQVDEAFAQQVPGAYQIGVTVMAVPLSKPTVGYYDPELWNGLLRKRGASSVRVTDVRYAGQGDAYSANWAGDLIDAVVGTQSGQNARADMRFVVTLEIGGGSGSGMGALPVLGVALAVLAVIAAGLAAYDAFTGKQVLVTSARSIGAAAGGILGGVGAGLGDALLPIVLVGALALFALKKSGSRVSTRAFSIGG